MSDVLQIPPQVGTVIDLAAAARTEDRYDRYAAAVLATLQWTLGYSLREPLTQETRPADRTEQLDVLIRADATLLGDTGVGVADRVHPEWASGVQRTLQWLLDGPETQPPPLPRHLPLRRSI